MKNRNPADSKKRRRKYTLQERIRRPYILLSASILFFCIVLLYLTTSRIYWEKSEQLCEQLVSLNLDLLEKEILEVQSRQKLIAGNAAVRKAVAYYTSDTERDYTKELHFQRDIEVVVNMLAEQNNVSAAYLVNKSGDIVYFYKESPKIKYNMLQEKWFSSVTEGINMDTCYISGIHDRKYLVNETQEECISIICPIQGEDYLFSAKAYFVCDIALNSVFDTTGEKGNVKFAVLDIYDRFYTDRTLTLSEKEREQMIRAAQSQTGEPLILHEGLFSNSIAVIMEAQTYGLKVIGVKNLDEIWNMALWMLGVFGAVGAVLFGAVAVVSRRVADSVATPVGRLVEECNRVAAGENHVIFEEKDSEEIAFLSDTIQEMVGNIVRLSDKLVEEERKVADEKIRVLQHQINPHFLNNVLQTIKGLAVSGKNEEVSRAVTLLGHILVYSVYEPYENVALKTELEYLKNYVELQNIRYDNKIICSIDCGEEAAHTQIPKLTLQPLVENAVEHGMCDKKTLILSISADLESDMVCIIVHDNGKGMTEQETEELRRRMETGEACEQKCSVGIINVNERIQRMYGRKYGIRIYSRCNSGTSVIVYVPRKEKNEGTVG